MSFMRGSCRPQSQACEGCKITSKPLLNCTGCWSARYCSGECQQSDWDHHIKVCKKPDTDEPIQTSFCSHYDLHVADYYLGVAPTKPEAQELAKEVGLILPPLNPCDCNIFVITDPIRRLVLTGKDTPENFALIFGECTAEETQAISSIQKSQRALAFLQPSAGTMLYERFAQFDIGLPFHAPRDQTANEKSRVDLMQWIQGEIKDHMGDRDMSTINDEDFVIILMCLGIPHSPFKDVINDAFMSVIPAQ